MTTRSYWQLGIVGQAQVRLVLGTMAVVGLAIWASYEFTVSSHRHDQLQNLTRWNEDRTARETAVIERVERQVREARRLLQVHLAKSATTKSPIPLLEDGSRRQFSPDQISPWAVFINTTASTDRAQFEAAMDARDMLVELAPTLAEYPKNLTIAMKGKWFAGWGTDQMSLARDMLPIDPVMLPAEVASLTGERDVSWSEAFWEPITDRWQIAATVSLESASIGRIAITQMLPIDELLKRATDRQASGGETLVYNRSGRLLAGTDLQERIAEANRRNVNLTLSNSGDPRLLHLQSTIADHGTPSQLVENPDGSGWYLVSRMPGPGWTEVTFQPFVQLDGRARTTAGWILFVGLAVIIAQSLLLVTVLRSRVARPLARLTQAALNLTDNRGVVPTLDTYRQDEVGELSRSFVVMVDAVAAREVDLRQANTALREREELARALVDSAADAVVLFGDGLITEANPTAETLFATGTQTLVGKNAYDLLAVIPHEAGSTVSRESWDKRLVRTHDGQTQHFPVLMQRFDKTTFEAEVGLARVHLPGQKRLLAVIRDVSARNQLERQLRQSQKLESLGQLAGGIAHDFNNMLAGIMGAAELLERQVQSAERPRKLLKIILTTCDRAAGLTRKLLTFARKGQAQRQLVNVHHVINDTIGMLEVSLNPNINVNVELTTSRCEILGDPTDLQNAILNLALNARDAMPNGGQLQFITCIREMGPQNDSGVVIPLAPGQYVELTVSDTGMGISSAVRAKMFEPFFTTKLVGRGTGLGLAAVYGMVHDHHGSMRVDSQEGKGTRFTLYLPLAAEREEIESSASKEIKTMNKRGIVMLVDDEDLVRSVARGFLEEIGWEVVEVNEGIKALELYRDQWRKIDVVMLDMEMPGQRGIDVLREMKRINPSVLAILCSGYVRDRSVEQLAADGFRAQLSKPYRIADLEHVLNEVSMNKSGRVSHE